MSLNAYFVSDLHLTTAEDSQTQLFVRFLRQLGGELPCSHLFLLGDIFDLWIADHSYFQSCYCEIIAELTRLRDAGVQIHYFEGNHDLYLQKFWGEKMGLAVHAEPLALNLGPWRLRLEHGDQMDPDDRGYIFLRWLLRTAALKTAVQFLPESLLVQAGRRASESSRAYTSRVKAQDAETARAKMLTHASLAHSTQPFDLFIAGHLHVREDRTVETPQGSYRLINLGWWRDQPVAFVLTGRESHWLPLSSVGPA